MIGARHGLSSASKYFRLFAYYITPATRLGFARRFFSLKPLLLSPFFKKRDNA